MRHRLFCLCSIVWLAVTAVAPVSANEAGEGVSGLDFKFMELRQRLREHPSGIQALHDRFALAEYYFQKGMPSLATETLRPFVSREPGNNEELLATVYLLRCAELMHDGEGFAAFEKTLQDALSSKQFVATFLASQTQTWRSRLGNRYVFREEVDRMEITLNDKPFYTIDLS